jgi:hypothetical protein
MTARRTMTLLDAVRDKHLFAPWFKNEATWRAWFTFLSALFALPMTEDQLALYRECTGRSEPPAAPATEAWLVCGRRAGKSFVLALVAVFLACFTDHRRYLARGERGVIMVIAADRKQARVILGYVRALLLEVPMLARRVEREIADAFDLNNNVSIEVATASFRSTHGYTMIAGLLDEIAFWRSEGDDPDAEIIAALRPAMATIPAAMLLCASSPYARRGVMWDAYRKHHGRDGPVLVWKAPTRTMNPTVPQAVIDEAYERDPASAAAEYGAEFRTDIETYISREVVEACTVAGRHELPSIAGSDYVAYIDPSGGTGDAMTMALAHREGDRLVLDCVRERRAPFSPDDVVREFADVLRAYGVVHVVGDRYAGEWPVEAFSKHGIRYEVSERTKSELYGALLPLSNSRRAELLDHARLATQFCQLERRTARGGRDSIDHAPGAHDDLANAVAGALILAQTAVPALWTREALGPPAAMPLCSEVAFAVLVAGLRGIGAVYCGRWRGVLTVLDAELAMPSPPALDGVLTRLLHLAQVARAPLAVLFAQGSLAGEYARRGVEVHNIDRLLADEFLSVSVAVHVAAGEVKFVDGVLAKAPELLDGSARGGGKDIPLRDAFLCGVAVAFDQERDL